MATVKKSWVTYVTGRELCISYLKTTNIGKLEPNKRI